MSLRRLLTLATAVALLAVAGLAVWRSTTDTAPRADRVAASLRCPSCAGETVADSRSPVAAAMREVIAGQLAAGRSPDQVRDWFAQRYGPDVLADPSSRGVGALLWILPGVVLLAGLALAVRTARRRPGARPAARPTHTDPARARRAWDLTALGLVGMVAAVAVAGTRSGDTATVASSASAPPTSASPATAPPTTAPPTSAPPTSAPPATPSSAPASAAAHPDPRPRLRLAVALIRAGQPAEAEQIAREVLAGRPADADAVLVLGLAERAAHSPAAGETLRRFLRLAPDHPAAAEVRRLLTK